MKIFDPKRHLPLGWDWENTRAALILGHFLSVLPLFSFLKRYFDAREALYYYVEKSGYTFGSYSYSSGYIQVLDQTRTIAPFPALILGAPLWGLAIFLWVMPLLVWLYYHSFTRNSMAVYTMRRLPDRWEYHRRCWVQPLLSAAAELILFALLIGLCWLLWYFATPAPCRPF